MLKILKILGGALAILTLSGGLYINSQREAIIEKALTTAEETASKTLGVPVKIGGVDFNDINFFDRDKLSDITVRDIEIFDKQKELIARVDTAQINFKLLALRDDPVAALDEIKLDGATLNLKQRDDESWNVNDIKVEEGEGETTFGAKVSLTRGTINAEFDGKNISLEEISAEADCADMNAIPAKVSAKTLGANVKASGTVSKAQQVISAEVDAINFDKILPYLPADKIPEGVEILGGAAENFSVHVLHRDDTLNYLGSTEIKNAAVKIEETTVENINGNLNFNESEIFFDASAAANDQYASASGKIHLDTDEIFFDVLAESESFTPAAILADIGIDGAVAVQAHLVGTAKNPQVDAEIYSDYIAYQNLSAQNISTKLRYVGDMIYLTDASANLFGGHVEGTAEIKTEDFSFNAHVKANGLDAATLCEFSGSTKAVSGKLSADVGINGKPDEIALVKIYGNVGATALNIEGFQVNDANASFYFSDDDLTLDYCSVKLPNNGTLGMEGTILNTTDLNLNFYGAHVDMALLKKFNAQLDMSGLADFKGTIQGHADNPNVNVELSAVDNSKREGNHFVGKFFKQPFDSIQLAASGSLDGININKFNLEKDGQIKWTVVEGSVGLTGEKKINLQLDTTTVRAEDIAALVAPDQPITGNVSNTVKITGTLDNPQVAGNIKFKRGSYRGILLSGMTGDYFLEGDILRLQDFEITSPMVDMILNGTINKTTQVMDFVVTGKDIRLERFKSKLPENYVAEGHTTFEGIIKGTPDVPIFDGELKANEITLNGVTLTDLYGHLQSNGANVYLDDFRFRDGDASCQMQVSLNLDSQNISGEIDVNQANIGRMFIIAAHKNELLDGTLNSKILVSGTLSKPTGSVVGEIPSGTLAGRDIHDVKVSVRLLNNIVYFNEFAGKQGDAGTFDLRGSAHLEGALDLTLTAKEIELALLSKAAGFDFDVVGTTDINTKVFGTAMNPSADVNMTATGGIKGSTFDLLRGKFRLENWRVNVDELIVQRELGGKIYGANAHGYIPLRALTAGSKENLPADEQLNLTVSLEGADLSLLPVLSKQIAWGIGNLHGSINITGTAASPEVNGKISLLDGSVKVKGMKTLIEHINIAMAFKGERFDIETFSGNLGAGLFTLKGGFSFADLHPTEYNFDFVADNLDIDSEVFRGKFNANFSLTEETFRHWKLPKLAGQINLEKCRISHPELSDDDTPLPNILLDVSINLGEKVHLFKSHLYNMYLDGNAHFGGSTEHPKSSGAITVKRGGTLTYLESVFNIREGEAHFNQVDSFMPTIHLAADTKVANTHVFLKVDGQPNNFKLGLTSSPEMTREEILKLLTLRDAYSRGGDINFTTADALAIGLQMTVLSEIEDALKRTLGIDQFTVSRGSGSMFERHNPGDQGASSRDDSKDYNVKIGKYIGDKFMIRYTRGFGSHKVNRYGIQYDFNDNIGLTVEHEGKEFIFSIEARYKF
ncbi:MAG: translocation/assembly module TamB domain-containing protein [Selenomonadaceae bacterium]|nr:translocation/assembly module TamB domain-containing protein [Selenomonadaceae bacterium]